MVENTFVLDREPSYRFRLRNVNTLFRTIIDDTPCPMVYISPNVLHSVPSPVSVRRIIRLVGSGRGLVLELKRVIASPFWHHAWLNLREVDNRWFEVQDIKYRNRAC